MQRYRLFICKDLNTNKLFYIFDQQKDEFLYNNGIYNKKDLTIPKKTTHNRYAAFSSKHGLIIALFEKEY